MSENAQAKQADDAPKIMVSEKLLAAAESLLEGEAYPSLCGANEIKVKLSHEDRNMTCYIRNSREGVILQLPNNKLNVVMGPELPKDTLFKENARQTVYQFGTIEELFGEFNRIAAKLDFKAPIPPKAKAPKGEGKKKTSKKAAAKGDASVSSIS